MYQKYPAISYKRSEPMALHAEVWDAMTVMKEKGG